jgi:hypothetical protein
MPVVSGHIVGVAVGRASTALGALDGKEREMEGEGKKMNV